ncbi:sulfate transport protein CysZ [Salinisphaera sp. PC39]|uniref:sulfate transporter CysZ n=1 Tax=Salinisphaera sp. PC39 TaxID=1304156 RepID=UPI0033428497
MRPIGDMARGPAYLWQGFALIREPGLRSVVALPLAINVIVIAGLLWLFGSQWSVWLDAWLAGLPGWLAWLESVLWWLGFLLAILLFCYFFTLLANLIAGPFNGILSSRVERHLTGHEPETGMTLWGEIADGAVGEARRLLYYAGRALLLGLLSLVLLFIPVVNALVPILWFAFGAYMLAFEYLDAPMGNRGLPFAIKRRRLAERRWLGLGFGGTVTLITALPLINLVVMPAAVAGATALWLAEMEGRE